MMEIQELQQQEGTTVVLKEKFVSIYEQLFDNKRAKSPVHDENGQDAFWDELLLLKVNNIYLEDKIKLTSEKELIQLQKTTMNPLFSKLCQYIINASYTRQANALQTLCILFKALFKKRWSHFSVDILNIVSGLQNADNYFKQLIQNVSQSISQEKNLKVKQLGLALFVILLTGHENIHQNALIDYFMLVDVFDCLIHVLEWRGSTMKMRKNVLVCLSILFNYRKYESMKQNMYLTHLKELHTPLVLWAFSDTITKYLHNWTLSFEKIIVEKASFLNYVYSFFYSPSTSSQEEGMGAKDVQQVSAMLLTLYELAHTNEDFVGSLTRSLATMAASEDNQKRLEKEMSSDILQRLDERERSEHVKACPTVIQQFLKFCSILFQEPHYINNYVRPTNTSSTKMNTDISSTSQDISTQYYAQFCLIILQCLLDKRVFKTFAFDVKLKLDFSLFIKEKGIFSVKEYKENGSLGRIIMELVIQCLTHHMGRSFIPMELYSKALNVTHSLLCSAKKFRIRFAIDWRLLWTSLIKICDIIADDHCNRDKVRACSILGQVLTIFNFGIQKGDLFFPTRRDQEEMIYQFIHQRQVFDKLNDWMERNLKKTNPVMALIRNIEIIISDITSNLDLQYGSHYPSELQVLDVIRKAMPEIKIVRISGLEQREDYLENPNEVTFFNRIMRLFVHEIRTGVVDASFQQKIVSE